MYVLVTGGAGYIGSHTCVELLNSGYDVIIADNLTNSSPKVIDRIRHITGKDLIFKRMDIRNVPAMDELFSIYDISGVIHFAGLKAVAGSTEKPLDYYMNNLNSTMVLCANMRNHGVKKLAFSSSATVYGAGEDMPLKESAAVGSCSNPYGWTKFMCERILMDIAAADPEWSIALLRYFNPIGAHPSGLIGEDPKGIPNNLMPYISQTAIGKLERLSIYGDDYNTPDGTGVRDYIHVCDLAKGHVAALKYLDAHKGAETFNLGTGSGCSVMELLTAFEKANDISVPHQVVGRRPGDVDVSYADPAKSEKLLGWKAECSIADMCRDSWNWQKNNPRGYED